MNGPRVTWALAGAAAVAGLLATFVRPTAPALPAPSATATALSSFDPDTLARVAAWTGPIRVAYLLGLVVALGVPWALVLSVRGRALVERLGGRRLATVRGALVPVLLAGVLAAPLRWWIGWLHAGRFGFRAGTPLRFVLEAAGGVLLQSALAAGAAVAGLWLLRRRPRDWVAVGTLVGTLATAVLVLVQPLVVTRVLYDPVPLRDPAVTAAVAPVLARSTLPELELAVGAASRRTTRVNAYVNGIGPTQQVVLWDTLLELPVERVVAVVGHEVAHAEHDDLTRGVLASATGILPALLLVELLRRRAGPRVGHFTGARAGALAVAVVVTLQLLGQPVVAWQSRRIEAAADARTLELVREPAGFVALSRGFVLDDLADPDPPAWVRLLGGSHPTPTQRIRAAVAFAEAEGLDPTPEDGS